MTLENKVALITGGGMGLGQVLCRRFAKAGAKVSFCDQKEDYLAETTQQVKNDGGEVFPMVCDITDIEQVDRWIAAAAAHFGRVDILVNNACYHQLKDGRDGAPIHEYRIDDFKRCVKVNVLGTFLCMRRAVVEMHKTGWGRIINIGSVDGIKPAINQIGYSTSMATVHSMTIMAARDLAKLNITANCIAPAHFPSHLYDRDGYEKRDDGTWGQATEAVFKHFEEMGNRYPIPGYTPVENVAAMAVFLAGEDTGFITAQILPVDAGHLVMGNMKPWPTDA